MVMTVRPVFIVLDRKPYVGVVEVEFPYFAGYTLSAKQKSITSLHQAFGHAYPGHTVLEVSGKSRVKLGARLSAFNLTAWHEGGSYRLECMFQAAKVFENGGPYSDLLTVTPEQAKRDPRLRNSGKLVGFDHFGVRFPLTPRTFFYDWIYVTALHKSSNSLGPYTAFTDIDFNPARSINCQARSVALYCGLKRAGKLSSALESPASFLSEAY